LLEKKHLQEQREQDKKVVQEKKLATEAAQRKEALRVQQEAKKTEAQRDANLKRITGLAGASGAPDATGTALHASGPSASYAGLIRARIKPNIVFADTVAGNPVAEVEVRTAPDGTIVSRKLTQASGVKSWDEAVLKAIDKTQVLPRDLDGRVPPVLTISFRPKD
jgi:colicin import membrane protein